jgi:hypothetical protein
MWDEWCVDSKQFGTKPNVNPKLLEVPIKVGAIKLRIVG